MPEGFNNTPPVVQQLGDNLIGGNLGGILSTRAEAKYSSGARTILRINGKIVGFAFGVSWDIVTMYGEITAIDNPLPEELIPQRIRVQGQISALHIPGFGAGTQLWQADILSFLFHQYLSIEVRDSVTDAILFYAPKAVITTRHEEIKVDSLAAVTLSFMAIGFRDEKNPTAPSAVNSLKNKQMVTALGDTLPEAGQSLDSSSSLSSKLSD